jgi:hypothetical protein
VVGLAKNKRGIVFNEDIPLLDEYVSRDFSYRRVPKHRDDPLSISGMGPRYLLPFFCAMLASVILGAFLAARMARPVPPELSEAPPLVSPDPVIPFEDVSSALFRGPEPVDDVVTDMYLDLASREWVTAFFARICGSPVIADAILKESVQLSIPPSLAFALSWEESRYDYTAVNHRNRDGSIDRGLFQLNSNSFPTLSEMEFFNPQVNVRYGIAHLRVCLDMGGSEVAALAMYNAGSGRVNSGTGIPRQTLDYVAKVLSSRHKIDQVFREEWARHGNALADTALADASLDDTALDDTALAGLALANGPRPILLSPLSR